MLAILASFALAAAQPDTASDASAPALDPRQEMALTCSAALATTALRQTRGDAEALAYPPLGDRGREFFIRATAKVMEETGMDREAIRRQLVGAAMELKQPGKLAAVMPTCLGMLEAAGL